MKLLLISMNRDLAFRPALPLGMITIASEVRHHGYDCECLDLCFEADPVRAALGAVERISPDIVGLSIRNTDQQTALEPDFKLPLSRQVVAAIRRSRPGCRIVLGGPAPSLFPEGALRYVGGDYVIAGPGERSFLELLARLEAGLPVAGIAGLTRAVGNGYASEPITPESSAFGQAPRIQNELYDARYFSHDYLSPVEFDAVAEPVLSKRACPGQCAYCGSSSATALPVAYRDIGQTVDQIESIARGGRARRFEFVDATFNVPYRHARGVCVEMARRKLRFPWNCMLAPHPVDAELADLMAETRCDLVEMGAESGCDQILAGLRKHFRRQHIASAVGLMAERDIKVEIGIFVGSPGDSLATIQESFHFLQDLLKPNHRYRVAINFGFRLLYGTELYQRALREGVVDPDEDLAYPRYYVSPGTLAEGVLEWIQQWVLARPHWYVWWGIGRYSLRERYVTVNGELNKGRALFRRLVPQRCSPLAVPAGA